MRCEKENFSQYTYKHATPNTTPNYNRSENFNVYNSTKLFLLDNIDDNIVFCVGNYPVLDMIKNLIISAKMNNISVVVFALDDEIVKDLEGHCDIVQYFNEFLFLENIKCLFG